MKFCKKVLSVLLSLALCGSMVAPAFAATFEDLQQAISDTLSTDTSSGDSSSGDSSSGDSSDNHENGSVFMAENGQQRQGYAWNDEANNNQGGWGIEAWDEGETRHVQLNEDVDPFDPVDLASDPSALYTEPITVNDTVVIDTAGNDINGNEHSANVIFNVTGNLTINGKSEDGKIGTIQGGNNIYGGNGGAINAEAGATVTLNDVKVTNNTTAGKGDGIYAAKGATVILTGKTEVSGNGTEAGDEDIYLDSGATLNGEKLTASEGTVWTDEDGDTTSVNSTVSSEDGSLSLKWTDPESSEPANPGTGGNGNTGDTGTTPPVVEIEDPDTPMAEGPISCAEFIYKLWLLDGEPAPLDDRGLPATVSEDHEYAEAIAWAVSADVASIETFDPEELLTVDLARGFLTNFAAYADMVMPELTTLIGDDDDLVLNTDDVLAEFFGRELDA